MFIRNAWYVAAWDRDLCDKPLAVTLLGEDIVCYRKADGTAAALEDACVHRKLPLSMGRIKGDLIECGYHGLTYNSAGVCVHMPCSERIPKNARVRSYPLESRYGLLWIWMGTAELARTADIMQVAHWDEPGWSSTDGDSMTVDCHYLYVTDNLLDPSHVAWVHPTSFGNASCATTPVEIVANSSGVCASRWMYGAEVAPLYRQFLIFEGLCDRLQHYEVRFPSHALIKAVFIPARSRTAAGAPVDDQAHPAAFVMDSYNFLTPVDATHTRYFWFQVHNAPNDHGNASANLARGVKGAFEEDRVILNAVQKNLARTLTANIDIAIDSAPLRFRRLTHKLIEEESAPHTPAGDAALSPHELTA